MYTVDKFDTVVLLEFLPQSSVGAPCPLVLSDVYNTVIAYYTQEQNYNNESSDEQVAIVAFKGCYSMMFGPPNDEAFNGHPLASRGLKPYSFFKIERSSWLRILQKMNSVHPYHNPKLFEDYNHFVLSFHDSTFECIAVDYEYEITYGTPLDVIAKMKEKLG